MKKVSILAAMLLASTPALATGSREQLVRDLVEVKNGRYLYDHLSICHLNLPTGPSKKFQMRSYAEAPSEGVISRDQFVAFVLQLETTRALGMAERSLGQLPPTQALQVLDCAPLKAPIGTVDLEFRTIMTHEGVQMEMKDANTGNVTRSSETWDEILD